MRTLFVLCIIFLWVATAALAQVSINTDNSMPEISAMLEVKSSTKGFLPPRMTSNDRDAITNPVQGLVIYCISCGTYGELQVFNGSAWTNMVGSTATPGFEIGNIYKGGIIAYISQPGDPGYIAGEFHGLIATPNDFGYPYYSPAEWGCFHTNIPGADGTALGSGNQNTIDIINGCATDYIAARACSKLELNGYSDWYLPSIDELNKIYLNKTAIGGFMGTFYWSSSEHNAENAWLQDLSSGPQAIISKYNTYMVRCVRTF